MSGICSKGKSLHSVFRWFEQSTESPTFARTVFHSPTHLHSPTNTTTRRINFIIIFSRREEGHAAEGAFTEETCTTLYPGARYIGEQRSKDKVRFSCTLAKAERKRKRRLLKRCLHWHVYIMVSLCNSFYLGFVPRLCLA